MDCYSIESEFIDSLDFLSPPVKRHHNSREAFGSAAYNNEPSNVHLLRGLRNKFATKNTRTVKTNSESSTSLILKRTSERKILEHYSIVSYTSLQHPEDNISLHRKSDKNSNNTEKPLIKVTVIPKSDQIQTAKILRKRRYIPKRVQSTTSNHENSVQTKNVYLIVAGRRREKIYEIKTTGSATFSTDHDAYSKDEEVPIKEISNFKHLIHSMNMDRKKNKEKKAQAVNLAAPQHITSEWNPGYPDCEDCMCKNATQEEPQTPKKSHVRIFGQFGISQDDKYVLRYGATVNDKHVLSDVAQLTRDFSPIIVSRNTYGTSYDEGIKRQKDSCIQADCDNQFNFEQLFVTNDVPSKESQGTQVNFNVQIASMSQGKCVKYLDKKIQCSYCDLANTSDDKALKACQSPLVIISVYPKQNPEDITKSVPNPKENCRCPTPTRMNTYTSNQVLKVAKGTRKSNIETKKNYKSPSISRSPSPIKMSSRIKMQEGKLIETKQMKNQFTEKRTPERQKALRAIKDKIQEKDKLKQDADTRKPFKYNTSHATQVSKNPQNVTISNATQVSNRNQRNLTSTNGTQVSTRNRQNYTVSNATQYSKNPQKFIASNSATQCIDSLQNIASIKHPRTLITSIKHSQTKTPQQSVATNATQISKNEHLIASNATQVSNDHQNFIASRVNKNQETYTAPYQVFKNEYTDTLSKSREKGTNTNHARTKKALVETYTKKLTEQMNQKDFIPVRFDSSKVTISIDGDKEFYNVLFNQDKLSTDLPIRKTLVESGSQKDCENECSASLENLLFLSECADAKGGPGIKSPTKSMSIALYNTQSDDELPLTKQVSRVTIRDSLEISHRREDKSSHNNNIKNTQTCFTAQLADNSPDDTEFLAPIKHFTGDDCSICDPIVRDKQIRELLGVDKTRLTYSKTQQAHNSANDDQFPYQCIYRQECKKSQVTEINFQFQKICPCLKPHTKHHTKGKSAQRASVSVQCRHTRCCSGARYNHKHNHNQYAYDKDEETYGNGNVNNSYISTGQKCCWNPLKLNNAEKNYSNENYNDEQYSSVEIHPNYDNYNKDDNNQNMNEHVDYNQNMNEHVDYKGADEKHEKQRYVSKETSAIYQQLILNRNIQVFLQVEQFSKQKPIVLSRKQYNKVKKTIQKTICNKKSSHDKRKTYLCSKCERSEVSVGEVRRKKVKDKQFLTEQEAQTDVTPRCRESCINKANMTEKKYRKLKSNSKHPSTETDVQFSGDHNVKKLLTTEPTSEPCKERTKSRCRKRRRSKEQRREIKPKVNQNIGVVTIEQFNANASWLSQRSEEQNETQKERRIGERNVERRNEHNAECNAVRLSERKEHGRRYNEQKGDRGPECHIQQKKERSPEQYSEQVGCPSPDRYSDQVGCPSPEKIYEKIGGPNPERYMDKNEENLKKDNDKNEDLNDKGRVVERKETEVKTLVLYNADESKGNANNTKESDKDAHTRKTMSSVEIRYASVAYMKHIAYSSTDVGALSDSSIAHANSFHTIFRGHRKSPTPNLGTSAYSLYSEDGYNSDNKSAKFIMEPRDSKPRKPFLRRLMSCLVMRSTRESELKIPTGPARDLPSVNSSIDSYHISTSLGAVEVSSSIYDTSASFYSNHTILPVNSKIKRGFFSSVRGFLTNRKS